MTIRAIGFVLVILSVGTPRQVAAWELDSTDGLSLQLNPTFKQTFALPGLSYSRLRLDLSAELSPSVHVDFAYEHQVIARVDSESSPFGPYLASMSAVPFRLVPEPRAVVAWPPSFGWTHGVDRAAVGFTWSDLDVTVGRQAIGLGRGLFFGAVDVFAPFSPLSVDREWRPGVDAIHLDWRFADLYSFDVMAAAGEGFDEGVVLGRLRGYLGEVDAALLGGRRAEDWVMALMGSGAVGDAALHAEFAAYLTDGEGVPASISADGRWAIKGLVGLSYSLDVAAGLMLAAEYHYNGFGLEDVSRDQGWLLNGAFQERLARGDGQTLGQHTLGVSLQLSTEAEVQVGLVGVQNLQDGSGALAPSVVWVVSDYVTLTATGFIPWGAGASGEYPLQSEYGAGEASALIQLALYE